MSNDNKLAYADRAGRFYAKTYGFPLMAGRLLGYLMVSEPEHPTIAELADALMASRSAITSAVQTLEGYHLVNRARAAGERVDRIILDPAGFEGNGLDPTIYSEQNAIFKEGLALLVSAPASRRAFLEDAVDLTAFLVERMPSLQKEWRERRDRLRKKRKQS